MIINSKVTTVYNPISKIINFINPKKYKDGFVYMDNRNLYYFNETNDSIELLYDSTINNVSVYTFETSSYGILLAKNNTNTVYFIDLNGNIHNYSLAFTGEISKIVFNDKTNEFCFIINNIGTTRFYKTNNGITFQSTLIAYSLKEIEIVPIPVKDGNGNIINHNNRILLYRQNNNTQNRTYYSDNGTSFTPVTVNTTVTDIQKQIKYIYDANNNMVLLTWFYGSNTYKVYRSTNNGISWTNITSSLTFINEEGVRLNNIGLITHNNNFVINKFDYTNNVTNIYYSVDGLNYSLFETNSLLPFGSIDNDYYSFGKYLLTTSGYDIIYTEDLVTFNLFSSNELNELASNVEYLAKQELLRKIGFLEGSMGYGYFPLDTKKYYYNNVNNRYYFSGNLNYYPGYAIIYFEDNNLVNCNVNYKNNNCKFIINKESKNLSFNISKINKLFKNNKIFFSIYIGTYIKKLKYKISDNGRIYVYNDEYITFSDNNGVTFSNPVKYSTTESLNIHKTTELYIFNNNNIALIRYDSFNSCNIYCSTNGIDFSILNINDIYNGLITNYNTFTATDLLNINKDKLSISINLSYDNINYYNSIFELNNDFTYNTYYLDNILQNKVTNKEYLTDNELNIINKNNIIFAGDDFIYGSYLKISNNSELYTSTIKGSYYDNNTENYISIIKELNNFPYSDKVNFHKPYTYNYYSNDIKSTVNYIDINTIISNYDIDLNLYNYLLNNSPNNSPNYIENSNDSIILKDNILLTKYVSQNGSKIAVHNLNNNNFIIISITSPLWQIGISGVKIFIDEYFIYLIDYYNYKIYKIDKISMQILYELNLSINSNSFNNCYNTKNYIVYKTILNEICNLILIDKNNLSIIKTFEIKYKLNDNGVEYVTNSLYSKNVEPFYNKSNVLTNVNELNDNTIVVNHEDNDSVYIEYSTNNGLTWNKKTFSKNDVEFVDVNSNGELIIIGYDSSEKTDFWNNKIGLVE